MRLPPEPALNLDRTKALGVPVLSIDMLTVTPGRILEFAFLSHSGDWRQGIWIGVNGHLEVGAIKADQLVLWTDTSPRRIAVDVARTDDGHLWLYNVWDSHRGRRCESQSWTSGMIKQPTEMGAVYRCNDIGLSSDFDKLVFEVTFLPLTKRID